MDSNSCEIKKYFCLRNEYCVVVFLKICFLVFIPGYSSYNLSLDQNKSMDSKKEKKFIL